jgi:hypothetical protein
MGQFATQAQVELSPNVSGVVMHLVKQDLVLLSDQVVFGHTATHTLFVLLIENRAGT